MKNTLKTNDVVYDESVKLKFFELIDTLYQKEYLKSASIFFKIMRDEISRLTGQKVMIFQ